MVQVSQVEGLGPLHNMTYHSLGALYPRPKADTRSSCHALLPRPASCLGMAGGSSIMEVH